MRQNALIQALEQEQLKTDFPRYAIGDTLEIHQRILETSQEMVKGKGPKEIVKERIQLFTGTLIGIDGSGLSETITLYKVSYGSGVERVFSIHSPKIAKIVVKKKGKVRRGKLYYLRGAFGKRSKVKEQILGAARQGAGAGQGDSQEQPIS